MPTTQAIDEARLNEFMGRFVGDLGAAISAALVVIGDRLGLYRAMGDTEPVTAEQLATRGLAAPEPFHFVSAFAECSTSPSNWMNKGGVYPTVAFYRDPFGVVHLRGSVTCPTTPTVGDVVIFFLPPGYVPALPEFFAAGDTAGLTRIQVASNGSVLYENAPANLAANDFLALDGISFRCEPSGANGCP